MRLWSRLSFSAAVVLFAGQAFAATPQEDLVDRWLKSLTFGYAHKVGASSFDPATQSVVLDSVTIGDYARDGFTVSLGQLTVEDPRLTAGGLFAAHAVRANSPDVRIRMDLEAWFPALVEQMRKDEPTKPIPEADITFKADSLLYERLEAPLDAPAVADGADLVTRYLAVARHWIALRADWFEVNQLTTAISGPPEMNSTSSYGLIYAAGFHDGRIERMGGSDVVQTSPLDGGGELTMKLGSMVMLGIDSNVLLHVLDPAEYVGGKGDGIWRKAVLEQSFQDIRYEFPGGTATIAEIAVDGVRVRQTPRPPLDFVVKILADPQAIERDGLAFMRDYFPSLLGYYGVDSVAVDSIKVEVPEEKVTVDIGEIAVRDVDSDRMGAFTVRNVAVEAGPAGSGKLDLFTLNDLRWGSLGVWMAIGEATESGGEPSPELIREAMLEGVPALGFYELGGLSVTMPEGTVGLDALAVTQSDFLKMFPRRYDITFTRASMPVSLITDPSARDPLVKMGYESLVLSGGMTFSWDTEKGDLRFDDVTLKAVDMGTLSADVHLGNLPLSIFDDPAAMEQRLLDGTLVSAGLTFGNQSIVERTFEMQAKEMNQKPEEFRKNFAAAMPFMLGFLEDKPLQERFAGVLQTFFDDPKSLVFTIRPKAPLPLSMLEGSGNQKPGAIMDLLGLEAAANR